MRILFIGDIVGNPGVTIVTKALPSLIPRERIDLVIANAENASSTGAGLTPGNYRKLRQAGVDLVTMGDHIYKKRDIIPLMAEEPICRPANFPYDAPGRDLLIATAHDGTRIGVFSLLGRLFMRPVDCPFRAADRVFQSARERPSCLILDMHAEATAEKALMARYLDGKVSAVLGTHTHVATADEQILPGGTAFITDAGMTGPYDSILGRRTDRVMETTVTFVPSPFDVATGDVRLAGVVVEINSATGRASAIRRVMVRESELADA